MMEAPVGQFQALVCRTMPCIHPDVLDTNKGYGFWAVGFFSIFM